MELTTKESFRRAKVRRLELADDEVAYIRVLSGRERDAWATYCSSLKPDDSRSNEDLYCYLLARTLCDTEGNRLFSDDDVGELALTDSKRLYALFDASLTFNRIGTPAIEDAKKNLTDSPNSTSGTP